MERAVCKCTLAVFVGRIALALAFARYKWGSDFREKLLCIVSASVGERMRVKRSAGYEQRLGGCLQWDENGAVQS